ncbi:MAG: RNA polymerase sigma factor [Phycisphaerales bacterium]|nr:MAG: RNA polymerase sigma factor [Phycisphaerales bacterium]
MRRIYEKYHEDLLRLAVSLSGQTATAEDVVHDVFTSFIEQARQFRLTGSLRAYLATAVAHRTRNVRRTEIRQQRWTQEGERPAAEGTARPDRWLICSEDLNEVVGALAQLPNEQREVLTLRLQAGMKFREIARFQDVPIKTALSRYRCGLTKVRSLINGEVPKCDR